MRERDWFRSLARQLAEVAPEANDTEVLARLKRTTLRAARSSQAASKATWLPACAAVLVAVAVVSAWLGWPDASTPARTSAHVLAGPDARWHRSLKDTEERILLLEGTLQIDIQRHAAAPPVLVEVPDGVIEDLGTHFSVTVHQGRTRRIALFEGTVVFHRYGEASVRLERGALWDAPEPPPAPRLRSPPARSLEPTAPRLELRRAPRSIEPPTNGRAGAEADDEDAAYLRFVTHLQAGQLGEARQAARAYLAAFPHGFRRVEVDAAVREMSASENRRPESRPPEGLAPMRPRPREPGQAPAHPEEHP
ncbi:MAG: FecR domain-containing protein [Myxococcales bacterium]